MLPYSWQGTDASSVSESLGRFVTKEERELTPYHVFIVGLYVFSLMVMTTVYFAILVGKKRSNDSLIWFKLIYNSICR